VEKVAVVGSGISGLTAAHYLQERYQVTVFEADDRAGGHVNTHQLVVDGLKLNVDSGFIVFNDRTYPNFIRLIDSLGITSSATEMSFSVSGRNIEYNGHNLNTLFADRRNLLRPTFLRMVRDIFRFNSEARDLRSSDKVLDVGTYLETHRYSDEFSNQYLLPMAAAIWSTGIESITEFPIAALVRFFDHHGLMDLRDRPQWRVIKGGANLYVQKIISQLQDFRYSSPVVRVERGVERVEVITPDNREFFDYLVIATHSDQALALLSDQSVAEQNILSRMKYTRNKVKLHTDSSIMPRRRRAWASWNYHLDRAQGSAALTYYMNRLQHLSVATPVMVTLNDPGIIDDEKVIGVTEYDHPFYNHDMLSAQKQWHAISGQKRTYFAGAYWRNGFHEDGVVSALKVCKQLGVEVC